ncbi:hypothetical protein SteCoe_35224 [Stentor coeruleus]|uniref:Superoxide dismutase n=1 Tax=Stentor coeruleus TaxID=5963 RepID=A0A1R2AT42_9CILI|nr:hypothetical protein SteCoe_35224 [Stentor coeruleus]
MKALIIFVFLTAYTEANCIKDDYLAKNEVTSFTVPKLPYTYDALNPLYWDQLLYFHHDFVHKELVDELNNMTSSIDTYREKTVVDLLQNYAVQDFTLWRYAGGHYSHSLFWLIMDSHKCNNPEPIGTLKLDIEAKWGTIGDFQKEFSRVAKGLYGSGWVWLCIDSEKKLVIKAKSDEYNPLAEGFFPFLGLDMWEHAYYFFYIWDRGAYVDAWWELVDWGLVEYLYEEYSRELIAIPI